MASAYLVRYIETKAIVGIYFARSLDELAELVDHVESPGLTEYRTVPPGGIEWDSACAEQTIPMAMPPEDAEEGVFSTLWQSFWNGASNTESWHDAFWEDGGKWKVFRNPAYPSKEELERAGSRSHQLEMERLGEALLDKAHGSRCEKRRD